MVGGGIGNEMSVRWSINPKRLGTAELDKTAFLVAIFIRTFVHHLAL